MAVSKRLRFEILRRDNHTCRYCGEGAPGVKLVIDHVVPEALGGTDVPENLVAACEPCNSGKTSVAPGAPLVADVKQDQIRWARAMEEARAIRRALLDERLAYGDYFIALWEEWKTGSGQWERPVPIEGGWRATIDKFFEHDVDPDDIKHALETAMTARGVTPENTFRYFCGIVWRIIRDLQEAATDLVMVNLADEMADDEQREF